MSSEPDSNPPDSPLGRIFASGRVSRPPEMAQEQAIAALEEEVQALKDGRLEERFCWILVSVILFNTTIFANTQTTGVPLAIVFLQIILLSVLARKCGMEYIVRFLDRIVDGWVKRGPSEKS
ncbi:MULTISPECIES: hypothetical protein [Roseomonadaceae]|uniref:Uncharacterized protein n=1 Tax=Falsiroseomonas oleicola TaxID=2801474 RepID=A0ABS6H665_9PROT|nr:hypothetical protein [Roseomonas oleicola]MBU8542996.1 hypothetical protein [Roseomonas oleicola]